MEPDPALLAELRRTKLEQARRRPPWEKAFGGAELFDQARRRMRMGLVAQHPEADAPTIDKLLLQALNRRERPRS